MAFLENFIKKEFVAFNLDMPNKEEVIHFLGGILLNAGYVKKSYVSAVLTREKKFPTGLATQDIHVAIPHTDIKHCLKPGMAVGLLTKPVVFSEMATNDKFVNAEIVFLLSITEPKQEVIWLSRLATLFQTPGLLKHLKSLPDPETFRDVFLDELEKAQA
jgi:galactitol PTS system EIIA component